MKTRLPRARRTLAFAITLDLTASLSVAGVRADAARDAPQEVPRTRTLPGLENAPFPYASPESVGLDPDQLTALVDLAQGWVAEDRMVGAEMLIVKDRKIVLHEAVGWSDREAGVPMARNSVFRLRSMTKPFTGTAALMLVEEGKLALDHPVSRYLESWDNERSGAITIEQLFTHTGGFVQGGTPEPAETYPDLRAVVDASGVEGPQHPPGERYRYSDVDSYTLGALVAELSGMPVERFIETRILVPLGLEDTHLGYSPDAPWAERMNPTYQRNDDGEWFKYWTPDTPGVFPYFRASGGILSTTFEYARWLAAVMDGMQFSAADGTDGGRLLTEETIERALTQREGGYGLHWEVRQMDPLVFGHSGSDGTAGFAMPAEDLMVFYFTQSRGSGTLGEWLEAVNGVVGSR